MRNAYKMSVEKPKRKKPFGRPRFGCEDIITTKLKETECEAVHSTELPPDRVQCRAFVNTAKSP
jgi:hypothetical protein